MNPIGPKQLLVPISILASISLLLIGRRYISGTHNKIETRSWSLHYYDEKVIPPPSKGHFH